MSSEASALEAARKPCHHGPENEEVAEAAYKSVTNKLAVDERKHEARFKFFRLTSHLLEA